jgi:hypothetical protein
VKASKKIRRLVIDGRGEISYGKPGLTRRVVVLLMKDMSI